VCKNNFTAFFTSLLWSMLTILFFIGPIEFNPVTVFLIVLYIFSCFRIWHILVGRNIRIIELMFWVFHANFLLLPAISQVSNKLFFWSSFDSYSLSNLIVACLIIFIGFISFEIGTYFSRKRIKRKLNKDFFTKNQLIKIQNKTKEISNGFGY
jgi:hypothetical protein